MRGVNLNIERSLSRRKKGDILFVSDFAGFGRDTAIRKSLSRLTQNDKIRRIAHGIYYIPKIDPLLGELYPSAEEIAHKVAQKEKVHIHPTGVYAMNKLGLSTQVPTKLVYLTDGVPRLLTIGKMQIKFKATTHKKLALKGLISRLVILALEELDLSEIDPTREARLRELLQKEDRKKLMHDLALTNKRIHNFIVNLLKRNDDGMAKTNK